MKRALLSVAFLLMLSVSAFAQTITAAPATMNFQGRLAKKDGTPVADGTHTLTFRIYDAQTGGHVKWAERIGSIVTRNGTFSAILGQTFPFDDIVLNGSIWLEIQVDTDAPLIPRQMFQSVAYALKANTVPDGAITTAKIADGAITQAKLASGVGGGSTSGAAGGDLTGTYPNPAIASNAVTTAKIADSAITATKIAANAVTNAAISSVDYSKITNAPSGAGSVPAGVVMAYAGATVPAGYLLCDGSAVSRTTYAALFAAVSVAHGAGDLVTTFNLPDYRGLFLRMVDGTAGRDPDNAGRTAMASNGNTGNAVGSVEQDIFASHSHGVYDPGHSHNLPGQTIFDGPGGVGSYMGNFGYRGANTYAAVTGISIQANGGNETRPKNAYVYYIIKY